MMRRSLTITEEHEQIEGDGSIAMPRVTFRREMPDVRCDQCAHWGLDENGDPQERTCARLGVRNAEAGYVGFDDRRYIFTPPGYGCSEFEVKL